MPSSNWSTWDCPLTARPRAASSSGASAGTRANFGEAPGHALVQGADRTGHMILQTLYQTVHPPEVTFFDEYQVLDALIVDGKVRAASSRLTSPAARCTSFTPRPCLWATRRFGRMLAVTSNAHSLTGDGMSSVYRRGVPLEDMEFFQFHPTGIYKMGILLSEAARGEGGVFINDKGERFMERYAPTMKDLASRDVCCRCIYWRCAKGAASAARITCTSTSARRRSTSTRARPAARR